MRTNPDVADVVDGDRDGDLETVGGDRGETVDTHSLETVDTDSSETVDTETVDTRP